MGKEREWGVGLRGGQGMRGDAAGGDLRGVELEMVGCGEGDVCARDGRGGWVQREIAIEGKRVRLFLPAEEALVAAFVGGEKFCLGMGASEVF